MLWFSSLLDLDLKNKWRRESLRLKLKYESLEWFLQLLSRSGRGVYRKSGKRAVGVCWQWSTELPSINDGTSVVLWMGFLRLTELPWKPTELPSFWILAWLKVFDGTFVASDGTSVVLWERNRERRNFRRLTTELPSFSGIDGTSHGTSDGTSFVDRTSFVNDRTSFVDWFTHRNWLFLASFVVGKSSKTFRNLSKMIPFKNKIISPLLIVRLA